MSDNDKSAFEPEPSCSEGTETSAKRKRTDVFKHGKPLSVQARHIVYNVAQYCIQECEMFKHTDYNKYFASFRNRAARATGVSSDTVIRVVNYANSEGKVTIPKPLRSSAEWKYNEIDAQFYGRLRDKITEFYLVDRVPDVSSINKEMMEVKLPPNVLSRILRQMGYMFIKTDVRGIAIVERLRSRLKRIQYLEQLKTARAEGRSIVFINQICVRVILDQDSEMIKRAKQARTHGKEVPLVLIQVWNENSDTPDGFLIYSLDEVTDNYDEWLRTKLILDVPENAAIVFTSSLHPNKYVQGYPYTTATKSEMKEWLKSQSINVPDNLTKPQLYDIILKNKAHIPLDDGENFLTDNGYMLLQMPKYHWGLNPVEMIWPKLVVYLTEKTPLDAENRVMGEIKKLSPQDWKNAKERSLQIEHTLIENEAAMDEITDRLYLHYEKHHETEEDWSSDDEDYRNFE